MTPSQTLGSGHDRITTMIGRAVEDLPEDSTELRVIVIDILPGQKGGVASHDQEEISSYRTDRGVRQSSKVSVSNYLRCTYYGVSNRKYPPSIRKGEQVDILQFGDSDIYYWLPSGRNSDLRTKDVLRHEIAAKEGIQENLNDENTYFFEMDSKRQRVTLKTSNAMGEKTKYLFTFDCKDGKVLLMDNVGNRFHIDTETAEISMVNERGSVVKLFGEDVYIAAPRDLHIEAQNDMFLTVGRNLTETIGQDVKTEVGGNVSRKVAGHVTESVGKNATEGIGGTRVVTVSGSSKLRAGGEIDLLAGGSAFVRANGITLQTASNTVTIP